MTGPGEPRVTVGIHVHSGADAARRTLASVRAHSPPGVGVVLLPDGPDAATAATLDAIAEVPQLASTGAAGAPACFNRLARATTSSIIVLLEGGAIASPGWMERLVAALDADTCNGLAGPSTNRAWNEQVAAPHAGSDDAAILLAADAIARRFGDTWVTLAPLYSLGDFCYAVRREVVDAIGDADERYGAGPCWEMDYNVRAARAGWRGVWARGAFVFRAPVTARRAWEERTRFEASKHLYQDKFCALRLRGERAHYESHCRGDACEHFAPAALIEMVRRGDRAPRDEQPARVIVASVSAPLASCIMPTRGRPDYALQAIRYWQRQDYAERELVVLDDGGELAGRLPDDPRIRHVPLPPGMSIGAKRTRGAELARGSFIVQWDDDDWFAPHRLSAQLAPLLRGDADISALTTGAFLALDAWEFWRCSPDLHRRLFVQDVHGSTLAFHRRVWEGGARYPNLSLAEDAQFLRTALRRGARLARLAGDDLFIYLRHAANSWRFECGSYLDPNGWSRIPEPPQLARDRDFYVARSARAPRTTAAPDSPLISCIMPTADRRRFVTQAIAYFQRQDHARRELVVVDDGADSVADLVPADARIRHLRLGRRHTIGAKRNIACEDARGDIIVHWDDDDWSAPHRLSAQVAALASNPAADVCGLAELFFYEPASRHAWRYRYGAGRAWVAGNTLAYRRSLWHRSPFAAVNEGEDTRFVWSADSASVLPLPDPSCFVAMVHGANTSPKRTSESRWHPVPSGDVRALLGHDAAFYDALGAPGPLRAAPHAHDTHRGAAGRR